jgi:NTP pyrophosphatase (non-canonical NTP hydrolase)
MSTPQITQLGTACFMAKQRADAAESKYGPIASTHEAMGVALEEWDEFREAIRSNDIPAAQSEALDLAAVLLRFASQTEWPRG